MVSAYNTPSADIGAVPDKIPPTVSAEEADSDPQQQHFKSFVNRPSCYLGRNKMKTVL